MDLMILTGMTLFLLIQLLLSMNINSPFKLLLSINSCLLYFYLQFAVWLVICVYKIKLWRLRPQKVDTEDYVFQNRVVPCNCWVQELVWCAVVVICGCLLVVSVCLLLVCSCMFVVCGCLWLFVVACGGLWWFVGGFWLFAGGLWSFAGGFWSFVVVSGCFWLLPVLVTVKVYLVLVLIWLNSNDTVQLGNSYIPHLAFSLFLT